MLETKQIQLYQTDDGTTEIAVKFQDDNIWLSLNQLSELFERDKSVISRHLKKIFSEGELDINSVVAKNATTATDGKIYQVDYFNLDAIIAVGYRVNSKRGTQFRIWAIDKLKQYLTQGYVINQQRLTELNKVVNIIEQLEQTSHNQTDEIHGLLAILTNYTKSFILLNQYDSNNLEINKLNPNIVYKIEYNEAILAISQLKQQLMKDNEATALFGNQKDRSFAGILQAIIQTFDGEYLYPSIEEQAAHLLYFVIKSHPFSDGNKRIGSFLFIWFLTKNKHLINNKNEVKINQNALTALALLVAQSDPQEKELMIKLICNLINE